MNTTNMAAKLALETAILTNLADMVLFVSLLLGVCSGLITELRTNLQSE